MGPLSFLLVAVGLSVVGLLVLWARHRESDSVESSIEDFERTRRALSADPSDQDHRPGDRGEA